MSGVNVTRREEAPAYAPPGHVGVTACRLQGMEAGGPRAFWVGQSTYPPTARADLSPVAGDTVYVVTRGELCVLVDRPDHPPEQLVLRAGDSVFLPCGTVRSVENRAGAEATLLVFLQPDPAS